MANIQKDISPEQLVKELDALAEATKEQTIVSKEILEAQEKEYLKGIITNPSAVALDTTKRESGENMKNRLRHTVRQLMNLYLSNQFVSRAINIRADTIISRGYKIIGSDEIGVEYCKDLVEKSGDVNLFWQLAVNTYIAGDGFLEKQYNKKNNKILSLRHIHPLTFGFRTELKTGKIIVGKDKTPIGYTQYYIDKNGTEVTKDVPKEPIEHLRFNTLGDEFTGLSIIQPGYSTIVRLMNMEYSAAEAAVKTANPMWIATCNTKSPHQIAQWSSILGNISGRDQLFIPEGMTINMMSPGPQNFNDYADYFLNAVVACFGVPKSVLLGDSGGSGNRAEGVITSRHFYSSIRSDQRYITDFFNKIFEEYGELAGFEPPKLVFEDVAEDALLLATSAIELHREGLITTSEARQMIGLEPTAEEIGVKQGAADDMKKSDMEVKHPEAPGSAAGSQAGEKAKMKISPYSEVSPNTK